MNIKDKGKIEINSHEESVAVQRKLFSAGFKWAGDKSAKLYEDAHDYPLGWKYGEITCTSSGVDDFPCHLPLHTLHDFGLRPGGFPELTYEDIVRGEKYRVRRDLELGKEYGGIKLMTPLTKVTVEGFEGGFIIVEENFFLYAACMLEPLTEADYARTPQAQPHKLSAGDAALDTKNRPCKILAIADGYAMCRFNGGLHQKHPVRAVELRNLRRKPQSITIDNVGDYKATVAADGKTVEVGCQEIPFAKVEEIYEAMKKLQS